TRAAAPEGQVRARLRLRGGRPGDGDTAPAGRRTVAGAVRWSHARARAAGLALLARRARTARAPSDRDRPSRRRQVAAAARDRRAPAREGPGAGDPRRPL